MIRFSCPRCKSALEQPDNAAGSKVACPKCSQRLQVPLPPTSKTILGELDVKGPIGAVEISSSGPGLSSMRPSAFDAQIRLDNGREIMSWFCPLCQNQVEVALDLGQKTIRCPHCAKKINVPEGPPSGSSTAGANPTAPYAPPASAPPGRSLVPVPPPPPPLEPDEYIEPRSRRDYDDEPRSRGRYRSRRYGYDDDDYDDDYDLPRPQARYKREYSTRAATVGFICSLISIAILVLGFILWVIAVDERRGRFGNRSMDAMVIIVLLATVGAFILGILGVVFGSRGMDSSNDQNRGMAVTGLVCGIVGLVLSVIFAVPFLLCGMLLWTFGGFR